MTLRIAMHRRTFITAGGLGAASAALPARTVAQIDVDDPRRFWRVAHAVCLARPRQACANVQIAVSSLLMDIIYQFADCIASITHPSCPAHRSIDFDGVSLRITAYSSEN